MLKTPLSTVIGGAFWTPKATILGGTSKPFDQIIKSLFANNEQGFFYDPNVLSTMFQDAAGTVPVTGVGQPVGLMLDKSKNVLLGNEMWVDSAVNMTGEAQRISAGVYRIYSSAGASSGATLGVLRSNKLRLVEFTIDSIANVGGGICVEAINGQITFTTTGKKRVFVLSSFLNVFIKRLSVCDYTISNVSVKEVAGNHAFQATSSMRPLLVASPQRLDYDTADDKLTTTLPAQLTGCTVIRSVPNVGTQILTGQTIPTPYNDNADHCGLIVINRALTSTETSQITKLFNKAAGV